MTKSKMRVVIMGCGGSGGVPYTGNVWGNCNPNNPKNRRTRPSIYIEKGDTRIVIDTTPEFRQQINNTGFDAQHHKLNAVLYTHAHNDHIAGTDDLRALWYRNEKKPIKTYGSAKTMDAIQDFFAYIYTSLSPEYPAMAEAHALPSEGITIGDLHIRHFQQIHGDVVTTGYRIGDFAYSTDVNILPESSLKALEGVKTWIVGCQGQEEDTFNHAGFRTVRQWVEHLKPDMTYLTHLNAFADYDEVCALMPEHIRPAYDGLEIIIEE